MNNQLFIILKNILSSYHPFTIAELTNFLCVSNRTIYNYWNDIENFLALNNLTNCINFDGSQFQFIGKEQDRKELSNALNSLTFSSYKMSLIERQTVLSVILLCSNKPIKNKYLSNLLDVSKNTIITDIHDIKIFFYRYKITISNENKGIFVIGEETGIREALLDILIDKQILKDYLISSLCTPPINYIMKVLSFSTFSNYIEKAILNNEERFHITLSDQNYYQLFSICLVSLLRNNNKYYLGKSIDLSNLSIFNQRDSGFLFAKSIFQSFDQDMNNPKQEFDLFMLMLNRYRILSILSPNMVQNLICPIIIQEFLFELSNYYKIDLTKDISLKNYLKAHISDCYSKLKKNYSLNNPYLSEIKKKYPTDFRILKEKKYIIENSLNISLTDGEVAYILMHILAAFERNKSDKNIPKIAIICHEGVATSSFLVTQVKKYFQVDIVCVCSIHNAKQILINHKFDLIISTIPLSDFTHPSLVVNAVLTEQDRISIEQSLNSMNHKLKKETIQENHHLSSCNNQRLFKMISEKTISLNKDAKDWREAINIAGELLLWEKSITIKYLNKMIELVEEFGPYIVIAPGIAFAHASPLDGVLMNKISIVTLKNPVVFGKNDFDPVSIIVGCAVKDSSENTSDLIQLMKIILIPSFREKIMTLKSNKEVVDYFKNVIMN